MPCFGKRRKENFMVFGPEGVSCNIAGVEVFVIDRDVNDDQHPLGDIDLWEPLPNASAVDAAFKFWQHHQCSHCRESRDDNDICGWCTVEEGSKQCQLGG